MGVTDAPSLEGVFGVAMAAGSDLSGKLAAQESVTFAPSTSTGIRDQNTRSDH